MLNDIISKLITELNEGIDERDLGGPYFDRIDYKVFPFTIDKFHQIKGDNTSIRNMVFIDGGNQELIGAPNFSIQLNRIYFNIYSGKKRIIQKVLPNKIEFFSATFSTLRNKEIDYDTIVFPVKDEWNKYLPLQSDLSFSAKDRTNFIGTMREDIQRVASISRRFAEWNYSRFVIEEILRENDILIADGSLQATFTHEDRYLSGTQASAIKRGVIFSGLSKTSSLFTTTGLSLIGSLHKLHKDWDINFNKWYYYPVAEGLISSHSVVIFIVKLHERADHIFRYEIIRDQAESMAASELCDILNNLAYISTDLTFPGYPYGLVDADDNARVRNDEVDVYRMLLLSEISKRGLWRKFSRYMLSTDAHDILNTLKAGGSVR